MLVRADFPIILHNVIVVGTAVSISFFCRNRHVSVGLGFLVGLLGSLLWRNINVHFYMTWKGLLYEPVFRGSLWRHRGVEDIFGFISNWVLPIILAYVGVWLWMTWKVKERKSELDKAE